MTVKDVIDAALAKAGYPDTPYSRKLVRKRWIGYINETLGMHTSLDPVPYTQTMRILNGRIFKCDLDYAPHFGLPIVTQFGVPLKVTETYNNPTEYLIPDALNGEITISYKACFSPVTSEEDDIGIYSGRFDKIVIYVDMRERMYSHNRGSLLRKREFKAQITDTEPDDIPEDTIICQHTTDDLYTLHYICPCGCNVKETVDAFMCDAPGGKELVVQAADQHGRPYTVHKSMPRSYRNLAQFMVIDGKITIRMNRNITKCQSLYTVENGIIKWAFLY